MLQQQLAMSIEASTDERDTLRQEELEALQKAIDIIADGAVAGAAEKHLPKLMQVSFALLRSSSSQAIRTKVVALLEEHARKTESKVLSLAASQLKAGSPFDKVGQMIRTLIAKLTEEANEEAEHKGWCDGELATNKQTREQKTEAVDELMALSDTLGAEIQKLASEMSDLSAAIADIDAAVEQATTTRNKEKAENTKAVADAKVATKAVRSAMAVLKTFYDKAATATALVQTKAKGPADDAPASFDTPYTGMASTSGGIMGMLEVILSDFVRLDEETTSEEASASRQYDEFSSDAASDRAVKSQAADTKTKTKTKKEKELNQAREDLARTQTELDAAMEYYAELKTSCVDADVSFQERVARRQDEIESLKEALKILSE